MAARPKKRRVIRIIIIILMQAQNALEQGTADTEWESLGRQLCDAGRLFDTPEDSWSTAQNDCYDVITSIGDSLITAPTLSAVHSLTDHLKDALSNM